MAQATPLEEQVRHAAAIVRQSRYCIALVGAGLSAESGIPTYRGQGGLWTRVGEPSPLSWQTFVSDPAGWWRNRLREEQGQADEARREFRRALEQARPNPAHHALAELERLGVLKAVITQNVDNLHRMAGSRNLLEVHGNRTRLRCLGCGARFPRDEFEINPEQLPPRCPQCQGIIKGDGVMFGEAIPRDVLDRCVEEVASCDCMLVLGTSGTVYPAAAFPQQARSQGAYLIEVNTDETPFSSRCDVSLRGPCGELLPRLVALVRSGDGALR